MDAAKQLAAIRAQALANIKAEMTWIRPEVWEEYERWLTQALADGTRDNLLRCSVPHWDG